MRSGVKEGDVLLLLLSRNPTVPWFGSSTVTGDGRESRRRPGGFGQLRFPINVSKRQEKDGETFVPV